MAGRVASAAAWAAAGILLGAATLAGGQGEEERGEKLAELEALAAQLRALEQREAPALPPVTPAGREMDRVAIADLLVGVRDYVRPMRSGTETEVCSFGGVAEEAPQPFGTVEEIVELLRASVMPETWESGGQIGVMGPSIMVVNRPDVLKAVRAFLDRELRPIAHRTVGIEVEIAELPAALAAEVGAAAGREVDPVLQALLDDAYSSGKAKRVFAGRLLARAGQRSLLWHGAQVATLSDADVEVAEESASADPLVDTELTGAILSVRATVGDDTSRIRIALDLDHDLLDTPIATRETVAAGTLQAPARSLQRVACDLLVPDGRWAVAGAREAGAGASRVVLVRPTMLRWEGGAR